MKLNLTPIAVILLTFLNCAQAQTQTQTNEVWIDEIDVSGKVSDISDKAFQQAGGGVIRGEEKRLQSLDSVVRALPGTYTNIDPVQGTFNVNIRGMAGLGRVHTAIDGVPQTFFGTATTDSRFHEEGRPPSSQYGTMIDPNFLMAVQVNKGFSAGEHGINALAGSALFKTIDVDDVVFKGNRIGVLSKFSYGTNALGYNGMLALAGKTKAFSETGSVGAIFAYSQHKIGSNYKRGDGRYAQENAYVKKMDQRPHSWLAKIELSPTEFHQLLLSARDYKTNIGGRNLHNKNYSVRYRYTPDSDLIDLELLASKTQNMQGYDNDAKIFMLDKISSLNNSHYINVKNTSFFDLESLGELTTTLGASYFNNVYTHKARGIDENNLEATPFQPQGRQRLLSTYLNAKWKKSLYTLEGGLTYSYANFRGFKPACGTVGSELENGAEIQIPIPCFPRGAHQVNTSHHFINPSIMLSADFSEWFSPFISYSRSTRMPNIQEVFFNNEGGGSMNPFLRPEKAQTYQIGFNTFKHNVFTNQDKLGVKLLHYQTKTKNFITSERFIIANNGSLTNDFDVEGGYSPNFQGQISINSLTPLRTKGVELEISYDSGKFFSNLSYSYEKTSQPIGVQSDQANFSFGDIYELPKHYATLDIGTRLLDKKLTLGGIIKYSQKVKQIDANGDNRGEDGKLETQFIPQNPMIVDLYASYAFNKHFTLKASVQNLFNSLYIEPLNKQNTMGTTHNYGSNDQDIYSFNNYARGRTYIISGEIRF